MDAALRVRVSYESGLGHWVRQTHLARALMRLGWWVTLFPDAWDRLPQCSPRDLDILPVKNDSAFLEMLPQDIPLVVLDVQNTEAAWVRQIRQRALRVAGFEDLGTGRNLLDLLVDSQLAPEQADQLPPEVTALFGWDYALIDPEILKRETPLKSFEGGLQKVLVTLGGTDPNHLTLPLTEALLGHPRAPAVTVVTGPGFQPEEDIARLQETGSFEWFRSPPTLRELLENHDAVFCAGGVTLLEALALGTPAFVVAQAAHQVETARKLEKLGATRLLGRAGDWSPEAIYQVLHTPSDALIRQSLNGRKLIDGRGLERIVQALLEVHSL